MVTKAGAIGYLTIAANESQRDGKDYEDLEEALNLAADALMRWIPKELVKTESTKRCPGCNRQITTIKCTKKNIRYCPSCGQALRWEN